LLPGASAGGDEILPGLAAGGFRRFFTPAVRFQKRTRT